MTLHANLAQPHFNLIWGQITTVLFRSLINPDQEDTKNEASYLLCKNNWTSVLFKDFTALSPTSSSLKALFPLLSSRTVLSHLISVSSLMTQMMRNPIDLIGSIITRVIYNSCNCVWEFPGLKSCASWNGNTVNVPVIIFNNLLGIGSTVSGSEMSKNVF